MRKLGHWWEAPLAHHSCRELQTIASEKKMFVACMTPVISHSPRHTATDCCFVTGQLSHMQLNILRHTISFQSIGAASRGIRPIATVRITWTKQGHQHSELRPHVRNVYEEIFKPFKAYNANNMCFLNWCLVTGVKVLMGHKKAD